MPVDRLGHPQAIRRGTFTRVPDLIGAIRIFIDTYNERCQRLRTPADGAFQALQAGGRLAVPPVGWPSAGRLEE